MGMRFRGSIEQPEVQDKREVYKCGLYEEGYSIVSKETEAIPMRAQDRSAKRR